MLFSGACGKMMNKTWSKKSRHTVSLTLVLKLCIRSICTSKCSRLNRLSQQRKKSRILHFTVERRWRWRHTCKGDVGNRVHTEWQRPLLAYISSGWKNKPILVRVGVHAHPLSLYLPSSTTLWCEYTIQRRQVHFSYFYSTTICTLWNRLSQKGKKSDPSFHSWQLVTSYLQGEGGVGSNYRRHTEWQWPLSGVYSIHDGKSSPSWWGWRGGCTPSPFQYLPLERADTLPLFLLYPYMYSVEQTVSEIKKIEYFISQLRGTGDIILAGGRARCGVKSQSTHREAMATFWRTFHHDGKINPSWRGWGGGGGWGCTLPTFSISTC